MKRSLKRSATLKSILLLPLLLLTGLLVGCGVSGLDIENFAKQKVEKISQADGDTKKKAKLTPQEIQAYYEKFNKAVAGRISYSTGTHKIMALDAMPKDTSDEVNWTAAVMLGIISPAASIDLDVEDEPPFDLNIFIEAKVPLMANVLFPHTIHTYWLKCSNCHPGIFLPQAGANDIKMTEIFEGKWCGRCHGKVAFTFWPRSNCIRCHIIPKGESLTKENWT